MAVHKTNGISLSNSNTGCVLLGPLSIQSQIVFISYAYFPLTGAEVATYTAEKFPDFLRKNTKYQEGSIAQALEDTFMTFDKHLTNDETIETLRQIAGVEEAEEDVEDGMIFRDV